MLEVQDFKSEVYLDYASTSPLEQEVIEATKEMLPLFYANPDALYTPAMQVSLLQEKSRNLLAEMLKVASNEIIFTGSASEANNMVIKGIAFANQDKGKHCITTKIEHLSVLNAFRQLEEHFGFEVTYIDVDINGIVNVEQLLDACRRDTILVSVMAINNEMGAIQPIQQLKEAIKKRCKAYFHVDFVQALGKYPIDCSRIDAATFSAHKIGGLKGSGLLFKAQNTPMLPLISGGQQEFGLRAGTSNSLANILWSKIMRIALSSLELNFKKVEHLSKLLKEQLKSIDKVNIHSSVDASVYICAFSHQEVGAAQVINGLNQKGFYVSAHSTCSSKDNKPSHVYQAMGLSTFQAQRVIRVSLHAQTTKQDIMAFIQAYKEVINYEYST